MSHRTTRCPARWTVLALTASIGLLAGCTGSTPTPPPATSPSTSPTPSPTPSTVAQENALASRIPLNGTDLVPFHWRLPTVKTADTPAVLAARRATVFSDVAYSTPSPAHWTGAQLAVEDLEATDDLYRHLAEATSRSWKNREAGPVWIWIMNIQRDSPDRVSIYQCRDLGWIGTAGNPVTKKWRVSGAIDYLVVSKLSHYPDGSRWKVTEYDITGGPDEDRYLKQCRAWAATHSTTEGWTLPPEPTTTPDPMPFTGG
jgi:hypothetical protein